MSRRHVFRAAAVALPAQSATGLPDRPGSKAKGRHKADLSFHFAICASTSVVAGRKWITSPVNRRMVNETLIRGDRHG
jgi:hypothetical protein